MIKTHQYSVINIVDAHHDCFSRNINSKYVILQLEPTEDKNKWLVEYVSKTDISKDKDYKVQHYNLLRKMYEMPKSVIDVLQHNYHTYEDFYKALNTTLNN